MKNYYQILGVEANATEEEIKKAYRKLAMDNHPDRHPGNKKKEEFFKLVSVAYDTLGSSTKRKTYDETLRAESYASSAASSSSQSSYNYGDFQRTFNEDMFKNFFNQTTSSDYQNYQEPQRKVIRVELTFWESVLGVKKTFNTTYTFASGKKGQEDFELNIPSGTSDEDVFHITTEQGQHFSVVISAPSKSSDKLYKRVNNDLHTFVEIPITLAVTGGKFVYSHWDGDLELKIPAYAQSGQLLRLKSKGIKGEPRFGDLFIELKVKTPTNLTVQQKELMAQLAATFEEKDYFKAISESWQET